MSPEVVAREGWSAKKSPGGLPGLCLSPSVEIRRPLSNYCRLSRIQHGASLPCHVHCPDRELHTVHRRGSGSVLPGFGMVRCEQASASFASAWEILLPEFSWSGDPKRRAQNFRYLYIQKPYAGLGRGPMPDFGARFWCSDFGDGRVERFAMCPTSNRTEIIPESLL
jgi:hypothetical protein